MVISVIITLINLTLNHASTDARNMTTSGVGILDQATSQMNVISDSTGLVNTFVAKLAQQTDEIEKMTAVIADITNQTNLLTLNASIEAARAGTWQRFCGCSKRSG